ncbi:MAG: T9SS type A sorting domain-containing protein, partial [Bacteroidales bacterium]|nr:T9SS type A sorting domain-containing protein [Bacteroidales bacterium]
DQNWLVQMELPSGTETGVSFDVATIITPVTGIAGGLCISDAFVPGFYTLAGNMQNEFLFGLELCPAGPVWLSIAPNGGTLSGGGSEDVTATFNTFDMLPGIYNAEIQFTSTPDVGSPVVDVTLTIEGLIPPVNMEMDWECTDVMITWEMPTGGDPDSWNIYRDGAVIGTATPPNMEYMDEMVDPETDYEYHITAVYDGDESSGTAPETMNVPMPEDMEPTDAAAEHTGGLNVQITWMAPEACVAPDEYEVFRDGSSVGTTTDLEFNDVVPTGGVYQYHVVAKYYFGDSDNSNFAFVLVGIEENLADMFEIYPNPASSFVNVKADFTIESYELLNNAGQVIMAERADATSFRVNVAQYENGIYYIKLYTEQGVTLRKIAID